MILRKSLTLAGLVALSSTLAGVCASRAMAADLTNLNNDLEIMGTILQTAVKQSGENDKRSRYRVKGITSTYLAGQGAVFTLSTNNINRRFHGLLDDIDINALVAPQPPIPELPPMPVHVIDSSDYEDVVIDVNTDRIHFITQNAIEQAHDALQNMREKIRDLREEERELVFEEREIVRRKRDIEFERRRAEGDRQQELQNELVELEMALSKLNTEKEKVAQIRGEMEEKNKQKAQKQKAEEAQSRKQFLAQFEDAIADSFCRYGSGMKSLDKKEKVNVILRNFGEQRASQKRRNRAQQDRIYVFTYKDIRECVADKIDTKTLLEKAEIYYF